MYKVFKERILVDEIRDALFLLSSPCLSSAQREHITMKLYQSLYKLSSYQMNVIDLADSCARQTFRCTSLLRLCARKWCPGHRNWFRCSFVDFPQGFRLLWRYLCRNYYHVFIASLQYHFQRSLVDIRLVSSPFSVARTYLLRRVKGAAWTCTWRLYT